jgi:predicted metalloendopeptidase
MSNRDFNNFNQINCKHCQLNKKNKPSQTNFPGSHVALTTFGVAPTQETALEMIHTIREAFNELLAENDWMDNETRAVAKEKADQMNERIGYPELLTNPKELSSEYIMVR